MNVAAQAKGGVHEARSPADTDTDAYATVSVGMAIALGAVAMTFAAVLLAYAIVRVQASAWPPPGEQPPPPPWPWPAAATLVALAGSACMLRARRTLARASSLVGTAFDPAHARRFNSALAAAAVAGIVFIGVQVCGWLALTRAGVRPDSGLVASVVYALTVFHALHALAAVIVLVPVLTRALRGRAIRPSSLVAVSWFWHLVTVVWLVVFVAVFVA